MWNLLEALGQDLKFTLRSLRHNPGFTLLAVVVMALGIGANTAVFSVVNTVLLKPLTYRDPDRIVALGMIPKTGAPGRGLVSPPISTTCTIRTLRSKPWPVTEVNSHR